MSPVNVSSIGSYIREQREQAKISIRQLAQAAGVSNPYLSQVERGLRRPSADILQQIAKGLRISAEALYVQAGILDDREGVTTVTDAIMADTEITERQKQMLIDIYESFRNELRVEAEASAAAQAVAEAEARAEARAEAEAKVEAEAGAAAQAGAAAEASEAEAADDQARAVAHAKAEELAESDPMVGSDPEFEAEAESVAEAEAGPWADLDPVDQPYDVKVDETR